MSDNAQVYSVAIRKMADGETRWIATCDHCGLSFESGMPIVVLATDPATTPPRQLESIMRQVREAVPVIVANAKIERLEITSTLEQSMLQHAGRCERPRR